MFSRKKIAAVSGLLGGLAMMTCAGATQAFAVGSTGTCAPDSQGNISCMQGNTGYSSDDGRYVVNQTQNCLGTKPVSLPAGGLLNPGTTQIGPALNCSNTAPTPQGFRSPGMG
ncbi:hypothetical protein [Streptomyces sp. NPDC048650]|uniref:hypothetical protein n=1 Tax=unclassified Streptomyces TaxID=2593676 RepID=UPI003720D9B5